MSHLKATHFMFKSLSRKSCRLRDKVEKYGRAEHATDGNRARCLRYACWINRTTYIHSEYVILIAFPQQQRLGESASILCYSVH
jgi:hypothetical protein